MLSIIAVHRGALARAETESCRVDKGYKKERIKKGGENGYGMGSGIEWVSAR